MKDTLLVFKSRRKEVRQCNHYPFLYSIVESGDVVNVNESKVSPKGKLSSLLNVGLSTSQIKLELQWYTGMFELMIRQLMHYSMLLLSTNSILIQLG